MARTKQRTWTRGILLAAGWTLMASAVAVRLAWAAVTFNTSPLPAWNGTNWVSTVNVVVTSNDAVCLAWNRAGGASGIVECLPHGNENPGDKTCTIPGPSVANQGGPITATYTGRNTNCAGTVGTTVNPGTFAPGGTGPLALSMSTFAATSGGNWALPLGLAGLGAAAFVLARRRRYAEVASAN